MPPDPSKLYGGNVGGPLGKRASFFLSVERTQINFKNAVNATILNSSFSPVPFVENVPDFKKRLQFSPLFELTLDKANTLMIRYSSLAYSLPNEGVSGSTLPDSGYRTSNWQQTTQVSETATLAPRAVNETKFQFLRTNLASQANSRAAGISVDQAFTSGSSSSALDLLRQNQWELQNDFSIVSGRHAIRAGIRLPAKQTKRVWQRIWLGHSHSLLALVRNWALIILRYSMHKAQPRPFPYPG